MRDHIDRAAEIIYVEVFGLPDYSPDAVDDHNRHSYRGDCECNASDRADARHAAEELDAAGLLASPERDRKVAAHTFRWAADQMEPAGPPLPGAMRHGWSAAVKTLRDLADESDRNAGERDE